MIKHIGQGFHISAPPADQVHLIEVDADYWKSWVHQRLATPVGQPGAMTFYRAAPNEHLALAKHLTAEVKTEEFLAGKGVMTRWEYLRRPNHWLDALYNACAAAYLCGVRLVGDEPRPVVNRPVVINAGIRMPDGRILRQEYREGPRIW